MPTVTATGAALTFCASVLWAARLVFGDGPWPSDAAGLLAASLVVIGAIVALATLLSPGRWVRNLATGLAAAGGILAIALDVDVLWIAAVVAAFAGLALLWLAGSDVWFRSSVRPEPVPLPAVGLVLGLIVMPGVVAAASTDAIEPLSWILAGASLLLGWAYGRALPWTVWIARLAYPALVAAAAFASGLREGLPIAAGGLVVVALAWTPGARLAVEPLAPKKSEAVSVLPEMVPPDLLQAAGYDPKGRPEDDS